jgi:hypothetical protein
MPRLYVENYLKDYPDEKTVFVPNHVVRTRVVYQKDFLR